MSGILNTQLTDKMQILYSFSNEEAVGKYTFDKMWVLFCQRLTAPQQSCVISEWGVRTNCITPTYHMIGVFQRSDYIFFRKLMRQKIVVKQTKAFSLTLDDWSYPGQGSHRDIVIKSNCVILCTA